MASLLPSGRLSLSGALLVLGHGTPPVPGSSGDLVGRCLPATGGPEPDLRDPGVDSDSAVHTLERLGLIEEKERLNLPGNPAVYVTTDLLLEKMGLDSLNGLPPLADHIPPSEIVDSLEETVRPGTG